MALWCVVLTILFRNLIVYKPKPLLDEQRTEGRTNKGTAVASAQLRHLAKLLALCRPNADGVVEIGHHVRNSTSTEERDQTNSGVLSVLSRVRNALF